MLTSNTKQCPRCNITKDASAYDANVTRPDGVQGMCRDCNVSYHRSWYKLHKDKVRLRANARNAKQRGILQEFIGNYLLEHPCVDCGFSDIRALDFDHVYSTKSYNVGDMLRNGFGIEVVKVEVAKCEVRCRNCHAIRTGQTNKSWREKFK